ncbi:MAG: response regulator, partial [Rhodocyclaceae bacterium]|nr:response regulator [Rhodocyclaceae bacterium]
MSTQLASGPADVPAANLLLVDDAPENLVVLAELLAPEYRISVAKTGERALALAQGDTPPDLILLDVMMPGMDGYAVLDALRSSARTA